MTKNKELISRKKVKVEQPVTTPAPKKNRFGRIKDPNAPIKEKKPKAPKFLDDISGDAKLKKKRKKRLYIDKKLMTVELRHFKQCGEITEPLGQMFLDIANHLSTKACFYNYSYKRDMVRDAVARMVIQIDRYNPDHPMANPFQYFSQVAYRQFLTFIKSEKRYANTKEIVSDKYMDDLICQTGMVDPRLKMGGDDEDGDFSSSPLEIINLFTDDVDTAFYVNNDVIDPSNEETASEDDSEEKDDSEED